jgi:predicted SPOUT superfamily RNA methylase MTH1
VAVAPSEPKTKEGLYWGYSVRSVDYFSAMDKTSPYPAGYQLKVLVDQTYGSPFDDRLKRKLVKRINKTELRWEFLKQQHSDIL